MIKNKLVCVLTTVNLLCPPLHTYFEDWLCWLASPTCVGQTSRPGTQAGVEVAVLRQNFFLCGKPRFLH